jgi:hypothetical protein
MGTPKPTITAFIWHADWLGIDWDIYRYAFTITRNDGGAVISSLPSGVEAGIDRTKMLGFWVIRGGGEGEDADLAEVILEVTYHSGIESLGLTRNVDEAEQWVRDANELLRSAKARLG